MIRPSDYADWQEYYWNYQNLLAKNYLIPMIEHCGITINNKDVLEIGCGSGGVIEAFAEQCRSAVGIDIHPFDYTRLCTPKVRYITADIYDPSARPLYDGVYDIIILRDVIEHLPDKESVFKLFNELLTRDGIIFMTFPPYYSPYGAHQQVFSKSFCGKMPWVHLLPKTLYLKYVQWTEKGNLPAYHTALELENSKTTIRQIYKHIRKNDFEIRQAHYYLIRPSYEIRYGLKPLKFNILKYIPLINELITMGVYIIIQRKKT